MHSRLETRGSGVGKSGLENSFCVPPSRPSFPSGILLVLYLYFTSWTLLYKKIYMKNLFQKMVHAKEVLTMVTFSGSRITTCVRPTLQQQPTFQCIVPSVAWKPNTPTATRYVSTRIGRCCNNKSNTTGGVLANTHVNRSMYRNKWHSLMLHNSNKNTNDVQSIFVRHLSWKRHGRKRFAEKKRNTKQPITEAPKSDEKTLAETYGWKPIIFFLALPLFAWSTIFFTRSKADRERMLVEVGLDRATAIPSTKIINNNNKNENNHEQKWWW